MELIKALRLDRSNRIPVICLAGSGGKTTALFTLGRQLMQRERKRLVILTATSHLGVWQASLADHHLIIENTDAVQLPAEGLVLVTGSIDEERTGPVNTNTLNWLHAFTKEHEIPLLIECDGSRQKPLKAPAAHEPPIPAFAELVIYTAGLSALGTPLDEDHVHRARIASDLTGLALGGIITTQTIHTLLTHPQGGLKNMPPNAKRIALLNQADTPELQSLGGRLANELLGHFDAVLIGSLQQNNFQLVERTAGVILAAGASSRYGQFKQLLDWKGKSFIRHIAQTALLAALEPVVVVTGFRGADVASHLQDLPVAIVHNPDFAHGQSTSIKAGISALPGNTGAAIFLLADQPQIPVEVIRALSESHAAERQSILAPLVLEEKRANPVLFDRITFPDLLQLTGDIGGRAIFDRHTVSYLPWHDDILILDVDKPEDYERLKNFE